MLQHFDTATLAVTTWKNGGGCTREILCSPPGAGIDDFDWRVSIATISQTGPFSVFAGVDRVIMLLEGHGVHLKSVRGIDHRLDQPCVPFAFSGDNELDCTLLGGTSTDFNVMTRRGQLRAEVVVLRESATLPLSQRGLLWVLRGTWALAGTSTCTAGQGLWWDGRALGGPVVPNEGDSVLVWVHLIEEA